MNSKSFYISRRRFLKTSAALAAASGLPHWFIDRHLLTYWNKFTHPKILPLYYEPLTYVLYWWLDPVQERALAEARAANRPVVR